MSKSTITKTWIGGLIGFAAGIGVSLVGVFLMLGYGGTFTRIGDTNNYNFTPDMNGFFWTAVTVIVIGGIVALAGSIVQLAAWIAALYNSYRLPDKTWFAILLVGGLLGFMFAVIGFAVMVAYIVAAPEGMAYDRTAAPASLPQQRPLAPTS